MSLDHVGISNLKDLDASCTFYEKALAPIGYKVQIKIAGKAVGFGPSIYKPDFWIAACPDGTRAGGSGAHVAFKGTRAQVHAFHEAALAAEGTCNGPPGFRPHYHAFYYASFVLDPDGNNIEIVNHGSAWQWTWYIIGTKLGLVSQDATKSAYKDD